MLQNIRDNSQGLIAKFIIGLIIIPFALFGIDSLVGGGGQVNVATVNGEDIAAAELDQAVQLERRRRLNMMGENIDPSLLDENSLRGPAMEQLIQQRLLLQSAESYSIGLSPSAIDQIIVAMPQFQENGKFSPQLYQNILRSNGYTTAYFKQLMAKDLLISQLNSGVSGSNFITQQELQDVARMIGQQRSFRYLILPAEKVAGQIDISEQSIESFYQENIDRFQTDEQLKLEYIELKREDFFKPVTTAQLEEAYQLELASLESSQERRAAHILIEISDDRTDQQALQLLAELTSKIEAGESFDVLAEQYSEDLASAQQGGDLGYTAGDTFPAEFEQALSKLALNELSPPVKTEAGYHLIMATEIKAEEKPSYEERIPAIQKRLQLAAAESELVRTVESLRDLVFNSEGLTGPAKELDLKVLQSDYVSRNSAQGVLADKRVMAAAFSEDVLEERNNSEVIELAADHFIVLSVMEHKAPHSKPLDQVRDTIAQQLAEQQSAERLRALANDLIEQLEAGKTLADIAEEGDYEWRIEQTVTRNSASVNRDVLMTAFTMPLTEPVVREVVSLSDGGAAIVQLDSIIEGSWEQFSEAEQQGIKAELERGAVSRSMNSYLGSLRDSAEITVL